MSLKQYIILLFVGFLFSCKSNDNSDKDEILTKSTIKYAKGFDIIKENGFRKLIIKSPYLNSDDDLEYIIKNKSNSISNRSQENALKTPVQKIIITSTTHVPMVELLNEEHSIVGFPHATYISSERTRKLVDEGVITEIGKEGALNTEIVLDLQPELVVGYSVNNANKSLTTIEKSGIPVIYNGDWLEETPLGRAEWIKFFGLLYNKEKQADSIFKSIELNYLEAKSLSKKSNIRPTILSGAIMNNDIWNLPAGDSFVAQFLKDANLNYLWKDAPGKGSLSLSFESVYEKGKNADFWIAPGYFNSKSQMLNYNELYKNFNPFKEDKIYTPTTKKGGSGGILYYELGPSRPDLILKDLIKITKPNLLKDYNLSFFEKMK